MFKTIHEGKINFRPYCPILEIKQPYHLNFQSTKSNLKTKYLN